MDSYRKTRLADLIATRYQGERGRFLRDARISKGRLTQLLDPGMAFGERAAKALVERLRLPVGYFETSYSDWPFSSCRQDYEALSPDEKSQLDAIVNAFINGASKKKGTNGKAA